VQVPTRNVMVFFSLLLSVNMNIDENADGIVNSPLVLTTEVCNPRKCQAGKMEGVCISGESCFKHGGQTGNLCNGSSNLICCTCQYPNTVAVLPIIHLLQINIITTYYILYLRLQHTRLGILSRDAIRLGIIWSK